MPARHHFLSPQERAFVETRRLVHVQERFAPIRLVCAIQAAEQCSFSCLHRCAHLRQQFFGPPEFPESHYYILSGSVLFQARQRGNLLCTC
jgi:hypothetical protein